MAAHDAAFTVQEPAWCRYWRNMNNRLKKRLIYRRHRIGLLIAAIESLLDLEQAALEAKNAG